MLLTCVFFLQLIQLHSALEPSLWSFGKLLLPLLGQTKAREGTVMGWAKRRDLSHHGAAAVQSQSHLWYPTEIETPRMLFIRSKCSCSSLLLESRELDSNPRRKEQVSHTVGARPLGTGSRARPERRARRSAAARRSYTGFLFARRAAQAVTPNAAAWIPNQTISDLQTSAAISNSCFFIMWKRPVIAQGQLLKNDSTPEKSIKNF